ncbi:citrate synthase [Kitasatospora sp. MMS16-BH015]|uniref:citrate synthase n=1 Tax=Kitasatospora sp. MMS16-BH015 TaxID=2018025 RepID=UPI000CA1AAFF|nr:citrate synthase [Kitasatospora sp. MMS16-BH015]AUG81400.1 citrate synthase [Kitasatospora sp. MMS16-BH015]
MSAGRLTTQQVAELLGVKVQTVYAYASRGLLSSERVSGGKGSTFDAAEVAALAAGQRRQLPRPGGDAAGTGGAEWSTEPVTVLTELTLIEDGRLYYRGVDVVRFAERYGFEAAIGLLWGVGAEPGLRLTAAPDLVAALRRAGDTLPPGTRLPDRLRVTAAVAASLDPLRFDLRPENVRATGAALIAALVEALPEEPGGAREFVGTGTEGSLAARLWTRLAAGPPPAGAVDCLDRALVLLADHELAVSTVAARVAASARAHPYAVVSAGLGASDGPLHGAASALAHRLLDEVLAAGSAVPVVSEYLRTGRPIPGLGHRLYPQGDPRAAALLAAVGDLPGAGPVLAAVEDLVRAAGGHRSPAAETANVDLALAAFAHLAGMSVEAGEVIFSVARTAGWLAHAMEEYQAPPLRMRARGVYTGPPPEQG